MGGPHDSPVGVSGAGGDGGNDGEQQARDPPVLLHRQAPAVAVGVRCFIIRTVYGLRVKK